MSPAKENEREGGLPPPLPLSKVLVIINVADRSRHAAPTPIQRRSRSVKMFGLLPPGLDQIQSFPPHSEIRNFRYKLNKGCLINIGEYS